MQIEAFSRGTFNFTVSWPTGESGSKVKIGLVLSSAVAVNFIPLSFMVDGYACTIIDEHSGTGKKVAHFWRRNQTRGSSLRRSSDGTTEGQHHLPLSWHFRSASGQRKSKCTDGCSALGTCNEELGRCDCPRHLAGPSCNQELRNISEVCKAYGFNDIERCFSKAPSHCLNECNHRGICSSGFCKCDPGTYPTTTHLSHT